MGTTYGLFLYSLAILHTPSALASDVNWQSSSDSFVCNNGQLIDASYRCDGLMNCADGSDETVRACAVTTCPAHHFECASGECVKEGVVCDNIRDCADGSDEAGPLCYRRVPRVTASPTSTTVQTLPLCTVPEHPEHGHYPVNGRKGILPGMVTDLLYFNATCDPGYVLVGDAVVTCYLGSWTVHPLPTCVRACKVTESPSVAYRCVRTENGSEGTRACRHLEPEDTVIQPECRQDFFSPTELPYMECKRGEWTYIPQCQPECGLRASGEVPLIVGGTEARRGEATWHVVLYRNDSGVLVQICGATLVKRNVLFSVGHCFWDEMDMKKLPAHLFLAAAGKLLREHGHPMDYLYTQTSGLSYVHVHPGFRGADNNYQNDLAVAILAQSLVLNVYVRPICVDFRASFSERQLRRGNVGLVAGHGLTTGHSGSESNVLNVLAMPFVPRNECLEATPPELHGFISGGKICAGSGNGVAPCNGDSGAGLIFPVYDHDKTRYYILAVLSTSATSRDSKQCNLNYPTGFEPIQKHAKWIKRILFNLNGEV